MLYEREWIPVSMAAAVIKVTPKSLWRAIRRGDVPAFGTRGRVRVRLADILPRYTPQGGKPPEEAATGG